MAPPVSEKLPRPQEKPQEYSRYFEDFPFAIRSLSGELSRLVAENAVITKARRSIRSVVDYLGSRLVHY